MSSFNITNIFLTHTNTCGSTNAANNSLGCSRPYRYLQS